MAKRITRGMQSRLQLAKHRTQHPHGVPIREAVGVDITGMECIYSGEHTGGSIIVVINEAELAVLVDGVARCTLSMSDIITAALSTPPTGSLS